MLLPTDIPPHPLLFTVDANFPLPFPTLGLNLYTIVNVQLSKVVTKSILYSEEKRQINISVTQYLGAYLAIDTHTHKHKSPVYCSAEVNESIFLNYTLQKPLSISLSV
jgi:hypothetical protein